MGEFAYFSPIGNIELWVVQMHLYDQVNLLRGINIIHREFGANLYWACIKNFQDMTQEKGFSPKYREMILSKWLIRYLYPKYYSSDAIKHTPRYFQGCLIYINLFGNYKFIHVVLSFLRQMTTLLKTLCTICGNFQQHQKYPT